MSTSQGRLAVIGNGYVGTVVAACFAALGRDVVGVEADPERLRHLRLGKAPFFEPGLDDVVARALEAGRLTFTDDLGEAVGRSDVVFLCVGTPNGADGRPDLDDVRKTALMIASTAGAARVLVAKSTLPIGVGTEIADLVGQPLGRTGRSTPMSVVSNPEFLRQGTAVADFLHPDRVVLGGDDPGAVDLIEEWYRPILDQIFPGGTPHRKPQLVRTSLPVAEVVKYAANAFLATRVSLVNEIANICELVQADVSEVLGAIGLDPRIGPGYLQPGAGWGGSCLGKDLRSLITTARDRGYEPELLQATLALNDRQRRRVVAKVSDALGGSVQGRRIGLLGLAFKPGTDDLRDAPALEIAHLLVDAGATVAGHDPTVRTDPGVDGLSVVADPVEVAEGADALVLVTDWPQYRALDLAALLGRMRGDFFLDGRNMFDQDVLRAHGFRCSGIGR